MIKFLIGLFLGGTFGFVLSAICYISHKEDEKGGD